MNLQRKTVLIIEDERPLLEIVQIKLESGGFDVVTARSVGQALQFLREIPAIDAVWLDHYLLGIEDGLDFVKKVKGIEEKKELPIFVVSNSASEDTRAEYINLGVSKYYVKSDHSLDQIIKDMRVVLEM